MGNKRPLYKGNILKSVYSKKIGITTKEFDRVMKEHGFIEKDGSIGYDAKPRIAKPYIGSNQKGTYQYNEKHLDDLFSRLSALEEL